MAAAAVAIGNELNEFSQLARDLRVGVNHLAMDTELSHQVEYYDAIQILEERINGKRKHHDEFNDRLQEIKHSIQTNADVLQYLKCITKLELPLTELTRQLTQAALDISDATSAPAVYANKKLGPNVSNCWEYIIELSSVVQTHLKDASVYQQFHHSVNEINAHLEKIITLNEVKMNIFCPEGVIKEARMLATELKNDYDEFLEMWEKAGRLAVISRQLRPIHNRLAKVVRGRTVNGGKGEIPGQIVMVKALVSMTGTNFQINKGDEMILVNNENEHLWKVQTTDGEREVASVIFGLVGPHEESVFQAEDLQKKIASTWKRVLERTRGKLTRYYTKLMKSLCENDAVYFTQEHEMNSFLDDLENLLIRPNYDGGQLQNAYDDFTNTVVLIASNRKPPRDSVVLSAEDIFILHAPLRSVLDQIINVDKVQAQTAMNATEVRDYIKSVELERQRISKELNEIEKNQSAQEEQLQSLARRMQDWKKNRLAFDKAINDYTMQVTTPLEPLPPKPSPFSGVSWNYNKNDPLLEHFPSTRILKPSYTVENDYQATSDGFDGDSNMEVEDTPKKTTPGVSRNLVFEGRHQPDTVPHYEMTTWTGGVKEIRKGLRRSASTSDLQTQIMNVTFSTATQYDVEDDVRHYATIACDPKGVLQKSYPDLFGRKIKKSDCQSQIFQLTKDVEVQVGVRVRPTAINLSKIDMNNLGVEVVDCSEASSLGLKVGSVICPITVRTEMELHDGAGIEILGISDVDSLAVQHKNKQMKAKKISSREVETQIITAPDGKNIIKDTKTEMKSKKSGETTDTQTQITVMSKPAAIQAVAVVEVMDVDSRIKAKPIVTETASSSRLLILPDSELDLDYSSEDSTEWNNEDNEVMAQIGCILHSRGVHVDIKKYLANYTTKQPSEMFDLSTQIESKKSTGDSQTMILTRVSNEESHSYDTTSKTRDAQTLIARVSRDHETQVSLKLIPTEVSLSKIGASIMEVSLRDKHAKRDLNLPMDSIICPSDIRFVSELYDGSEIKIVDYKDVARLLVSHEGVSVVGEITIDKKENCIPVGVQAAVVFKTSNSAQSVLPKLVPGCVQMTRRPERACPASSSDVQVQIITQPDSYFEDDDDSKTMNTCELKSLMSIVPLCEHCTRECQDLQVQISTLPPKFVEEGTQFNKSSRKRVGTADCRMEVRLVHNSDLQTLIPNSSRRMSDSSESIVSSELSNIPLCEHCMHMCQDLQVQVNTCPTVQQNVLPDKSLVNLCENCTQICRNLQLRISVDPLRTTSVNNSELLKETIRKCISSTECRPRLKLVTATIENSQAPIQKCIANHICRKDDRDDYATSSISFNLPLCNECKRTCQDLQAQINTLQTKGSISEAEYKAKSTMAGVPLCAPCKRRYLDLQVQITAFPVNPSVKVMKETSVQVGAELTTSEICLSKYELQNIQLTMDEGINDINGVALESFICPAKIKVKTRLTEGSSIKMVDFDDTSDAVTIRVTNTQSLNAECGQVLPDNMIGSCVILNPTSETSKKTVNALICGAVSDKKRKIRLMEIDSVMMSVQKATVEASTQVGARLMSSSISLCQVPVENMIVEIENTTTNKTMEMGATSLLFPTNTRITTVLCEEEGIQISSLEDVENLQFEADDYEMSRDLLMTDVQTQKGFKTMQTSSIRTGIVLKTNQWCTKLPAATTTATVKNLLKHIKPEPKMRISIGSSKYTSKCDISVQVGKMIRDDSTYTFDINNESTIKSTIEEITRQAPIILDHKTTIQTQPTELKRVIDASVQVGARLVPQTVTISQVRLENVAVCLEAPLNRSEMEVSATSLLCPGQIQLTTMLCEGDGISIVDMEDIQEISFMHQAPTRSCDLQTQIMTSAEKSFDDSPTFIRDQMKPNRKQHELMIANLEMKVEPLKNVKSVAYLPAQLILETGQYSSQTRQTPAVTASVVAAMLADPKTKKNLSIVAKKEKKALFGSNQIGSINRDQNTQTDFVQSRKMINASMQVGVRIVPESIEMMNLEVEKLEINYSTPGESQNFTVNSIVCPAKVHAATRLCEESGIQIASINDVDEVPINAPNPPQLNTFTTPQTKLKSGWWSTVTQGIRSSSASTIENSSSERLLPKSRHQSPKETYDIVFEASAIIQNSDDSQTCDLKQTRAILSDKQHQTKLRLKKTDKSSNAFRQNSIQSCEQQTKKCNQCTQVGVKMIPQEVNLSKLKLEDMQLEVRNDLVSKILSLPANSILYPAEVTLDFNLCEDSGIQVVKFSDVNEIGINTSTEFGSSNVMKYTISSELRSSEVPLINAGMNTRKAFLQAAIVIEKADRDLPLIGSTASVCRLLQNEIYEVHMKSPIKPTESSRNVKGPVCRECGSFRTQTSVIPTSTRKTASVSCQVGTRIIPEVIEFSTAKIKRLEMECCNQEKPEVVQFDVNTFICPATIHTKTELFDGSGIKVDSLNETSELKIMSAVSTADAVESSENFISGNWRSDQRKMNTSSFDSSKKYPKANVLSLNNTKTLINSTLANSFDYVLQASALIQATGDNQITDVEEFIKDNKTISRLQLKGIKANKKMIKSNQVQISGSLYEEKHDQSTQVGVRMVPQDISLSKIHLEGIQMEVTSERISETLKIQPNSILYPADVHLSSILCEDSGIQFVKLTDVNEMDFSTSVMSSTRNTNTKPVKSRISTFTVSPRNLSQTTIVHTPSTKYAHFGANSQATTLQAAIVIETAERDLPVLGSTAQICRILQDQEYEARLKTCVAIGIDSMNQVGAILVPTQISLEQMHFDTTNVDMTMLPPLPSSVLCTTNMRLSTVLTEASGIQVIDVKNVSDIGIQYETADYLADVIQTSAHKNQASIQLRERTIVSNVPEIATAKLTVCTPRPDFSTSETTVERSSGLLGPLIATKTNTVDTAVQCGTVLVPTKVCMNRVEIDNLEVVVPMTGREDTNLQVSAILCSSGVQMQSVLTDTSGIQVVNMKDVGQIGIQINDQVYVANVENVVKKEERKMSHASIASQQNARRRSVDLASRADDQFARTVLLPVRKMPHLIGGDYGTAYTQNLVHQNIELTQLRDVLQNSTSDLRLQPRIDSSRGMFATSDQPDYIVPNPSSDVSYAPNITPETVMADSQCMNSHHMGFQRSARIIMKDACSQLGLQLIPQSVEVKSIKMENMDVAFTNETTNEKGPFNVGTMICFSGVQYNHNFTESAGIQVLAIDKSREVAIHYREDSFHASVESHESQKTSISNSTTSKNVKRIGQISDAQYLQMGLTGRTSVNTDDNECQINLKVHHAEISGSCLDASYRPELVVQTKESGRIGSVVQSEFHAREYMSVPLRTSSQSTRDVYPYPKAEIGVCSVCNINRLEHVDMASNFGAGGKSMQTSMRNNNYINAASYESKLDQSTQVGVRMVPQDISLSKIRLEGIQMEVTSERISETLKIQPNSILYPADVHLSSILCEDSGIQVVKLTDVNEMDFSTSVMSSTRKTNTKPVKSRISTFTVSPRNLSQTTIVHTPSTKYAHFGANSQATTLQAAIVIETAERDLPVLGSTAQICRILQDQEYEARLKTCVAIGIDSMNQVGAILVPTQISLEQMNFDTSNVDMTRLPPLPSSVLCTTNMQLSTVLTEASGIQVIDVKNVSDIGIQYETADYLADVIQTSAHKNQASIQLRERTIVSNVPEIATAKLTVCTPRPDFSTSETTVERSSGLLGPLIATKTNTVDTAVQCGTVLVPTKVCMNRVEIDNLEVVVPMTGREDTNLQVSAILCSSGVQMQSVLTDTSGIQVVNMKDIGQIGIQINDQVYVANVENVAKKEERKMSHASIASQQNARRRSVDLASKADDQFVRTVLLPVRKMPHLIGGDYGTAYTQNLVHQNIELTQLRDVLQNSTIELRLQQRIDSSRSIFATSDQPDIIVPNSSSDVSYAPNITPETVMADSQCMNLHQIGLQRSARIIMKDACSQLGLQLIPQSVEVKSIKMENMDVAFTNETTNEKGPFNVGTMICFSGVQYNHNFTESAGIQVLAIDKSREVAIHYREDSFHASVESHESQKTSISNSTTSKNLTRIGQISDAQYLQMGLTGRTGVNTDDNECQINLRVHHAEISGSCLDASYRPELGVQTKESGRIGSVVQSEFHAREYMSVPLRSSSQSTRDVYPYPKAEIGVCSVCNINRLERVDMASNFGAVGESMQTSMRNNNYINAASYESKLDQSTQVGVRMVPQDISLSKIHLEGIQMEVTSERISETLKIQPNSILYPADVHLSSILCEDSGIQFVKLTDVNEMDFSTSVMSSTRNTNTKPVKSRISTFTVSPRNLSQTTIVHTPSTKYAHFGANSQATTLQAAIVIETAERDLPVLGSTAQICRILQDQEYEARLKTCVAIGIDSMNQVGAILVPTQISLQQMNFDTNNVDMTRLPPLPSSVLCTTNMQLSTVLAEASGIQVIDVKNVSDIGIQYETADYLADVIQTSAHKNQASIQLRERTIVSNVPEIATAKLTVCTPRPDFSTSETTVERSSGLLGPLIATKTNTVDTAVQCGTVLVPTKVCMNRVEIDNLEVVVPMTGREDTNLQVSAILCSSGVQMQSVLTDNSGIQVVNMKDIGQIGIQINDQVYLANVENVAKKEERKMSHASIASQQHASRRSVDLASRADDQFARTVLLPVRKMPHLIGGDYGTAYTQNLVHQNIELTQLRDVLQNSTIELRLQQRIDSSRSIFATSDQPDHIVPNPSSDVSYAPNITPETVMADSQCMNSHQIGLQRSARIIMKDACSQLGLQLIPQSVEVKSIKMENMDVAFTNETTNEKGPFNVGTMICFSGVQYNHNFTESAGIQVLAIDKSREVAIHYREDSFHASVESHESQKTSISNSTTSKNLTRIGQISDAQYLQMGLTGRTGVNTDDNECQINLRVHHAEISGSCLDASYRPELGVQTKESGRIGSVVQSEFHAREYMSVPLRSSSQSTRDVYPYPKAEIGACSVCNINRLERFNIASQVGVTIVPMEINMKNVDLLNAEMCLSGASGSESLNIPLNSIMCPASIEMCTCLTNSVGIQMFNESDLEHLNLNLSGQQILAQLSHPERRRLSGNVITRGLNNQVVSKFTAQSPTRPQKQVNLMEPTMLTASAVVILDTTKASSNTITVPNQNSNVHETVIKLLKDTYSSKTLQLTGENKSGLSNAIATQNTAKEGQFEFMRDGFYGSLTQRNSLMPSYTAAQSQKYDSVQDGTFSGPLPANDASVQVGTIFTPTQIQIEKIDLKNAEIVIKGAPEVTEYQVPLSSILVPASMQMTCDLTECSGISISHMKDTSHLGLSFGNDLFVGTIENDNSKTRLHLHQDDFTTTGHTQLAENTTFKDRLTQRDVGHTISVHGEVRRISVPGSESVAQFACQYCGKENQATSIIHPGQRSYLEENIVKTSQTGVFSRPPSKIKKELKSASVQVGLQLRPKSIALEKCGVDNMLLEVKDDKMGHNLEFPVGAVFYPVNLEMDMELTNRSGIEIQNIHDINEIVVEHGSMDKHVADVYFPPLKRLVNSFESNISRLSTDIFEGKKLQSKTISLKTASVVFPRSELVVSENTLQISSTKSIRGVLAGGNSERRLRLRVNENISNIQDLQISSFTCQCGRVHASTIPPQPALHLICNYCGNLDGFVTNTTEIEEMPKQTGVTQLQGNNIGDGIESFRKYNVTCEAAIEPVMISKRLTANITPNSIDVGMQFSNTNISTNVTGETIVMLECTADRYYCVPSSISESTSMKRGSIDMPVKNVQISTQCNIIHRDTLVETLKSARMAISGFQQTHTSLSQGKYTQDTSSTPLGESIMVNKQFLSESTTAYPQQYEENVTSLQMKKKYDDSSKYICLPGETEIRQINMIGQNMVHGDDLIKSVKSEGIYSSLQQNMEYTGCEQNQQPLIKMRVDEEQLKSEGVHQSTQPQKSQGDYKTRSIFPQDGQNFTQEVPRTVVDMHNESVQSHTSIVQNSLPLLEGELSKPGAVFICGKCKCEELLKDESFTVGIIPTKIQSESHIQRKLTGSSRQSVRFREALCERCTVKRKGSVTCAGCGCNLEHISRHPSSFRVENKNGDRSPRSTISISQMPSEKPSSQFFVDTSKQTHHYFGTNPDQNRDGFSSDGSTTSISSTTLFEGNSSEFERQGSFTTHQLANGITTQQAPHSLIEQATISGSLTDRNRFVNALTTQEARELAEVIVNAREVEEGTNEVHPVSVYQRVQGHSLVKKIIASYETDKSVHRHSVAVQTDEAVSVEPSDSNRPIQIIQREPRKKRATYSSSISSNDGEDGEDHCPNFLKRISPHLSLPRRLCDVSCSAQIGPDSHDKNIQVSFPENSTT